MDDRAAQMEAAKLLAQEFKSGGNSRRGGGVRAGPRTGGGTSGVGVGRTLKTSRSELYRSPMSRPMPTNSRPALAVGNANRAPTQINPSLAGWLGGQSTNHNKPTESVPTATKDAVGPVPVNPKLASWLTNNSQPQALSVDSVPHVNATAGSNTSVSEVTSAVQPPVVFQAQAILEEPKLVTAQVHSPASTVTNNTDRDQPSASGGPSEIKATSKSKYNGLGSSMWASEDLAIVRTQDMSSSSGTHVDTATSSRASAVPEEQQPVYSTAAEYDDQVSRLLEADPMKDKSQRNAIKAGSNLLLHQQPKVGTMLWALQQLDAGLELPDSQQFKTHGYRIHDDRPHFHSVDASQPDDVNGAISQSQNQITKNDEKTDAPTDGIDCHCPKRSHPVIGLAASKYNTDADGDVDISGMSTAARNKFAVNVILHDHSIPDCPVLLRTKAKYPLYFGANPATVSEEDDGLSVTV